jgi:hypothetical protein
MSDRDGVPRDDDGVCTICWGRGYTEEDYSDAVGRPLTYREDCPCSEDDALPPTSADKPPRGHLPSMRIPAPSLTPAGRNPSPTPTEEPQADPWALPDRAGIFHEIDAERSRQDAKWGPVRRQPHVDPVLAARGADHFRICQEHEIPNVHRAKFLCQEAERRGECSFTAIAVEELCEAVEKHDDEAAMRVELVQLAAVIVKWIESLALPADPPKTEEPR